MEFIIFSNNQDLYRVIEEFENVIGYIDLENIGKLERQKSTNSYISDHIIEDIKLIKRQIKPKQLGVRINPIGVHSEKEINKCIEYGVSRIMLPMFQDVEEVNIFKRLVKKRVSLELLFETPKSIKKIATFDLKSIDYIHVGLNDLSLALGNQFMHELLVNDYLEEFTLYLKKNLYRFGIGGIGAVDSIPFSPDLILASNLVIGSQRLILSRSFKKKLDYTNYKSLLNSFNNELKKLENLRIKMLNDSENLLFLKERLKKIIFLQKKKQIKLNSKAKL